MPLTRFSCCFFVLLCAFSLPQRSKALVPDGSPSSTRTTDEVAADVHFANDVVERRRSRVLQGTASVDGDLSAKAYTPGSQDSARDIIDGTCEHTTALEQQKWIEAAQQAAERLIPDTGIEQIRLDCSGQNIVVDFLIPERLRPRPPALPGQQQAPAFPGADYYARVTIERTSGTVLRVFGG